MGRRSCFCTALARAGADFASLFPLVVPRWRVLALDFRGHGRSGRTPGCYHVVDYVEDVLAVLQTQTEEAAVIYGHSLGALVAAAVAAREPGRVRAVVLEDPPSAELLRRIDGTPFHAQFIGMQLLAGDPMPVAELARQLAAIPLPGPGGGTVRLGQTRDPAALRFSARWLKDVDPEVFTPLTAGRWLAGYDGPTIRVNVRCPALLLRGDETHGGMLGRAEAEQWVNAFADGTLIDVPGVGHLLHWMAADTTGRLMLSFLESLR